MTDIERFNAAKRVIENGGELERDTCKFLIEQLEAAQRERDELKEQVKTLNSRLAACKEVKQSFKDRAWTAEEEIKRRGAQKPVAIVEPSDYVTAAQLVGEGPARKAVHELYEGALKIGDELYAATPAAVPEKVVKLPARFNPRTQHILGVRSAVMGYCVTGGWIRRNALIAALDTAGVKWVEGE